MREPSEGKGKMRFWTKAESERSPCWAGRQETDMSSVTCSPRQPGGQSQGPRSHSLNDGNDLVFML